MMLSQVERAGDHAGRQRARTHCFITPSSQIGWAGGSLDKIRGI
jgi:hypothetical protein